MSQDTPQHLRLETVDDVTVVSFADNEINDEGMIQEIGDQLYDAPAEPLHRLRRGRMLAGLCQEEFETEIPLQLWRKAIVIPLARAHPNQRPNWTAWRQHRARL